MFATPNGTMSMRDLRWLPPPAVLVAGLLIALCGFPASGGATTMPYTTLPELVEASDLIVRGVVTDTRSFVDPETERITTRATIDDEVVYLGDLGRDTFEVEQWGGRVDGRTLRIPGNARWEVGQEVVVFLEYHDGPERFPAFLVAMTQAKFDIDYDGDDPTIRRSRSGVEFVDPGEAPGKLEEPTSLESFVSRLESLIYAHHEGNAGDADTE